MKKFIAMLALSAMVLAGCGSRQEESFTDDDYVGVCVSDDGYRVDDNQCTDDGSPSLSGFFWGYFLASALMPSHGSRVSGYKTGLDRNRYNLYRGGAPRNGGYVDFKSYKPLSKSTPKVTSKPKSTTKSGSSTKQKSGGNSGSKSKSGGFGGGGKRR